MNNKNSIYTMKSSRIIIILFLLVCPVLYGFGHGKGIDLFLPEVDTLNINNKTSDSGKVLSGEDLKTEAIYNAYLGNEEKAIDLAEKYIKSVHDITILSHDSFLEIKDSEGYKRLAQAYLPKINIWLLFFFASGLIGVFLSIVINLRRKGDLVGNILISSFVLFHSLFMIHLCIYLSRNNYSLPHTLYFSTSFSFLYGPLLYFYFKRISEKYRFKWIDMLHLIPSVLLFLYLLPIYLLPAEGKVHLMFNRNEILYDTLRGIVILKYISLIAYAYLVYKQYRKIMSKKKKPHFQILNWQRNMMVLNMFYVFFYIVYGIALLRLITSNNLFIYPQTFSMSVIILYVGYIAYVQPKVFSKKFLFQETKSSKYKKSGLTISYSEELKEQLLQLLDEEKVYKQSNISLEKLATILGTTRHNISQVINEHFGMNFFHLINKYRIAEAVEILKSDYNNNLNIIDVAYDVGFNNKVTFNKAFKAETNMTPSSFLRERDAFGFSS